MPGNVQLRALTKRYDEIRALFAVLSVGLGLANLIPYDGSDGAQLLRLWRAGARRQ